VHHPGGQVGAEIAGVGGDGKAFFTVKRQRFRFLLLQVYLPVLADSLRNAAVWLLARQY